MLSGQRRQTRAYPSELQLQPHSISCVRLALLAPHNWTLGSSDARAGRRILLGRCPRGSPYRDALEQTRRIESRRRSRDNHLALFTPPPLTNATRARRAVVPAIEARSSAQLRFAVARSCGAQLWRAVEVRSSAQLRVGVPSVTGSDRWCALRFTRASPPRARASGSRWARGRCWCAARVPIETPPRSSVFARQHPPTRDATATHRRRLRHADATSSYVL